MCVVPAANESHTSANIHRRVTEDSILAVQVFDQKKFKKKDQGFLGVINIRIGDFVDFDSGEDGMQANSSPPRRKTDVQPLQP